MAKKNSEGNGKIVLLLLWLLWPIGLIWYLVDEKMKNDSFVKFHFKQWLIVVIVLAVGLTAAAILNFMYVGFIVNKVMLLFALACLIQALISILKGEEKELLLVGKYAKEFKF